MPEIIHCELVKCYMCGIMYDHPVSAVGGYGKCWPCFFEILREEAQDVNEWAESPEGRAWLAKQQRNDVK